MTALETVLAVLLCLSLGLGPLYGHGLGFRQGRAVEREQNKLREVGRPESYAVDSPDGFWIRTPSKLSATQFAVKHGGEVYVVAPE